MKKLLVSSLSVIALAILGTGCLKDKDFEDQQYGTQVNEARAVSFPQSRSASSITYGVVSSLTALDIVGPFIFLEAANAQSADTRVTLSIDDALVTADPSLTIMPTTEYNIDLVRVIAAGRTYDSVVINLPQSANLDPNLVYGIGLRIVSADNDFDVASNMRELLLKFTVKNKYDGVYENDGTFIDNFNPTFAGRYPLEYRLVTTGPSSVDVQLLINGNWEPGYLFFNGTGGSFFGNYGLTMEFDPATDAISEFHNYYGDPSKSLTNVGDPSLGSGAPLWQAAPPRLRSARLDPTGVNAWDGTGATPIVTIKHQLWQADLSLTTPRCEMDEVWTRTGDRP